MKKPHLGILLKPTSSDCNLTCDYCYYRGVREIYPDADRPRMSLEVLEEVCLQYRALQPADIKLGWQGGEPTLMGLDFFKKAIEVESRNARAGDCWGNSLQTNGLTLDDDWCGFFARHHFLVGLSVDGPAELNGTRRFRNGRPTHDLVMRAAECLKKHQCEFNILVVVSAANVGQPEAVLRFLTENELRFSQCIPCTEPAGDGGRLTPHSITGDQWSDFMIRFFEAWVAHDDPGYYNRHVDNWLHLYLGLPPESCEYRPDCSNLVTVEWNGDVYPCDFFVQERYRMGNVLEDTLEHMLQGRPFRDFVKLAEQAPAMCGDCRWMWACNGGCWRQRGKLGLDGQAKPYMCEANQRIFEHVFDKLDSLKNGPEGSQLHAFLKDLERRVASGEFDAAPPERPAARPAATGARRRPRRNAPCPCGSGRKFKQCCMSSATNG